MYGMNLNMIVVECNGPEQMAMCGRNSVSMYADHQAAASVNHNSS